MKTNNEISISIPTEISDLFNWVKKYNPNFKGKSDSEILEAFLVKGFKDSYEESFKGVPAKKNKLSFLF